ncbi:hypothetical protein N1851_027272 [Merluccius polli]|uniref:Reverse transcriptase domain-containing protein n=1 Tax=Merluccius polli TaxID=89951 RepID=A0AA47MAF7_MERPO|nr:hypothetical protein N1851_027272 [Merluccius polli]
MDRISRHSRGPECIQLGGLRVASLLFADDVVSSDCDLRHSLERCAAECDAVGMKVSTSKSKAMASRKKVACPLWFGREQLAQVEEFMYLGVLFTSEGMRECEIDRRMGAASAVMQALYRTAMLKRELSRGKALNLPVNLQSNPHLWS